MNEQEYTEKKNKLLAYLTKAGIDNEEVEKYIAKEEKLSLGMGLNMENGKNRALLSAVNYYRKYLDKIGNRIKFIALGMSSPTDYGLTKKVKDIKKRYNDPMTSNGEREEMIYKKLIDEKIRVLHTNETTLFEDKYGSPINVDEELSQEIFGVVEAEGKTFPAIVRLKGKVACEELKPMYQWCFISGEQSQFKNFPDHVGINSRELLMKPVKDSTRINLAQYEELIRNNFRARIINVESISGDVEVFLHSLKGHYFLENTAIGGYDFNMNGMTTTHIHRDADKHDIDKKTIIDMRIPNVIELNVDPDTECKQWIFVQLREKKQQDKYYKAEALGMYVETPADRSKFAVDASFVMEVANAKEGQPVEQNMNISQETEKWMHEINKRQ